MTIQKILIPIFLLIISHLTYADIFKEGTHYKTLNKPLNITIPEGKIEVRELFWYYCPHCAYLEPVVDNWLKNKPKNVEFVRQPAVFSKRWANGAVFYYVLEGLGEVNRLHNKLFLAIHDENLIFNGKADFVDWLVLNGVDRIKANKVFSSFHIRTQLNKASLLSKASGVNGVPSFVINGKYTTSVTEAGSQQELFKVIDYLVKKSQPLSGK